MDGVILESWKRREVVDTADTHLVEVEISRSFYLIQITRRYSMGASEAVTSQRHPE